MTGEVVALEPADDEAVIDFKGEWFRLSGEPPSQMAMMELAAYAEAGADTLDQAAMAVILDVLHDLVHADDWSRFKSHARRSRATGDELMMDFAKRATEAVVDRPSKRSSDASDGPLRTVPSSTVASSSPAPPVLKSPDEIIGEMNGRGRPDLALVVRRRQDFVAAQRSA